MAGGERLRLRGRVHWAVVWVKLSGVRAAGDGDKLWLKLAIIVCISTGRNSAVS